MCFCSAQYGLLVILRDTALFRLESFFTIDISPRNKSIYNYILHRLGIILDASRAIRQNLDPQRPGAAFTNMV